MQVAPCYLALVVLVACGPETASTDDVSTGTDSSGETGNSGETGTTEDAGGTDETGVTPTTGGPPEPVICAGTESVDPFQARACQDYLSDEPGPTIEVGVINKRDEVVFLRGFGNTAPGYLRLTGEAGGRTVHYPFVCNDEPASCDSLVKQGEPGGCLANDKLSPPLRIEPGARAVLAWSPYLVFHVSLPDDCLAGPGWTCTTGRRATPGAYTLTATYVHEDECTGACSCTPDSSGACALDLEEVMITGTPIAVTAVHDGACPVVDLVIE